MLFTGTMPGVEGHVGYLAGRYRNGALSDVWTDASRCAERTFTAWAAGCSCGWYGSLQPLTTVGQYGARRQWANEHLPVVLAEATAPSVSPTVAAG
ncbi:hypothetical protein PSU4_04990 [Pseudonocardia sulfidoxydans NBRC 16205]|uniref:Uncharacterized protein n=1 Tax=Pseudonocardia sulfidoxydans NBRC 16205 TaxID=1223511 RepID=A0A511D9Q7_9PSEU|nr:hypothetical protein [Pseudonocardia sulfidoxydans]GEL21545.1 hypothetical protein PSU4_04990 [Pseudonocardia sulfidoxydans NBRC 16205]